MAHIVLIHGIAQEFKSSFQLQSEWSQAIAGAVEIAGNPDTAAQIASGTISSKMAFYGDLFRQEGRQGTPNTPPTRLSHDEADLLSAICERACLSSDGDVRKNAERLRQLIHVPPSSDLNHQGIGAIAGAVIAAVSNVPWLARLGYDAAATYIFKALSQVTAYLSDDKIRAEVQNRVAQHVNDETFAIIGHSLGSVVAFEACHASQRRIPLMLTLGSPIGLAPLVYTQLRPQPPHFPPNLVRWENVADVEDFVACVSNIVSLFPRNDSNALPLRTTLINNGASAHSVSRYLSSSVVGRAILDTINAGRASC